MKLSIEKEFILEIKNSKLPIKKYLSLILYLVFKAGRPNKELDQAPFFYKNAWRTKKFPT